MPRFNNCIITGCGLYVPPIDVFVWGDLFEHGDMYVLNGERCEEFAADGVKCLIVGEVGLNALFERKGVFIVPKTFASLNQPAKDYLNV